MANPTLQDLSEAYCVSTKTLRRFKAAGVDLSSPSRVLDRLLAGGAARTTSCMVLERLARAERKLLLEAAAEVLDKLNGGNGRLVCPCCGELLASVDHDD